MPYLLYIDTTHKNSNMLLMNERGVVSSRKSEAQLNHGEVINKYIQEMIEESGIGFGKIDAICVLNGPGSYTGLRISLSTAKGICYAKDIPLILINKLDLLKHRADKILENQNICTIIKAREDEYFSAFYSSDSLNNILAQLLLKSDLLIKMEKFSFALCFEDLLLKDEFEQFTLLEIQNEDILELCFEYFSKRKFADLYHSEPFYLKNVHINKINKL